MYTVTFSSDDPLSIEWDEGFSAQGLGPGWFIVPTLKIAHRCLDAQVITEIQTHDTIGSNYIVTSWDTLSHMYFSLEQVPHDPPDAKWDGTADVIFRADGGTSLTFKGAWLPNSLIQMVYSKDGFGKIVAYTAHKAT